jgi:crotonobetaine/carnitine-CoA ligase
MNTRTVPSSDCCVVRDLIDRHAREIPDRVYALFEDGTRWTYRELREQVVACAAGLQKLGVAQGDFVLSWLPNGPDAVRVLFGLNYLGAVYVPINLSYRGGVLRHVIANSGARLMIADARLVERLASVETASLATVVAVGGGAPRIAGLESVADSILREPGTEPRPPVRPIAPWDTQSVIYTSGTTGPSKGVLSSYLHPWTFQQVLQHIGPDDCNLASLPMFHATGFMAVYGMLVVGGRVAVIESFRTPEFWDTVRRYGVTTTGLLGVMMQFLLKQPTAPSDRDNTLRTALVVPLDEDARKFSGRFGVDIYTIYNMTEMSAPIYAGPNPSAYGSCGRVRAGVEVRLVDDHDIEVAPGQVGEMIVRTDLPWAMNHGYHNDPEATARAWRNGWFHTGDAFRCDADGNFYFIDRLKDAIRRRGENISSFEVEREIAVHPAVREVAVVGVADEISEQEALAVIAPAPGRAVDPAELIEFLRPRLAHFMIPRYVRILPELPKTPTQKVLKHVLREQGLTADTWDRERAGIVIARERPANSRRR